MLDWYAMRAARDSACAWQNYEIPLGVDVLEPK